MLFPIPGGPITLKLVSNSNEVNRQNIRPNYGTLFRGCPIRRFFIHSMVVVEREEICLAEWVGRFFRGSPCIVFGSPASNLEVTSCCAFERLQHTGISCVRTHRYLQAASLWTSYRSKNTPEKVFLAASVSRIQSRCAFRTEFSVFRSMLICISV